MIKCYYHSADLDGMASGAIVKYKFPGAELIPINYGTKIDYSQISRKDTIYMVDFSLQPFREMVELASYVGMNNLIWIDHHNSSLKDADDCILTHNGIEVNFNQICPGKRQDGKAGCELTWEYLFPDNDMPTAVSFLGRYDVWDLQGCVLAFQFGMRLNNTWPDNQEMWQKYFDENWGEGSYHDLNLNTIHDGETILKYQKQENEKYCNASVFELEFEGYKAICSNKMLNNSQFFESVWDNQKYDIMISFGLHKNGLWTFSFYTDKAGVDCSILAKKFGGGGHVGASGCQFEFDKLPIEFLKQIKKLQPVKFEEIPKPEDGEHMTMLEFIDAVKHAVFTDDDGIGRYATETQMTNISVSPSYIFLRNIDERWSHVVWFNK